ncbi:MAG: methylated-DNA--[protein]-cysteine S-methyltransferase [Clostridia bacterium]|nr:methylated-DNA--[protein]-cysteine S-methyltransferase [Clostridia bacterium]
MKYALIISSPIGALTLVEEDGALTEVRFGEKAQGVMLKSTELLERAARELDEYFRGERRAFTIPLNPHGTPFQKRCWDALCRIPCGETRTYAQQAAMIGNPKACRAVGMGNHRNPLPIFIPCHRVIGKNGTLTGYAGGLDIKETLLNIERMTRP